MEALDKIDLDCGDLMALPANMDQPVINAIQHQLDFGSIHSWIDLYLAGAEKVRDLHPDMPTKAIHEIVVPLVSQVIEDAI